MSGPVVKGPFAVDSFGENWAYVVNNDGDRVCECDDIGKANQVCDALNAMHYIDSYIAGSKES